MKRFALIAVLAVLACGISAASGSAASFDDTNPCPPYPSYNCTPADTDTSTCQHTNVATQTGGKTIFTIKK